MGSCVDLMEYYLGFKQAIAVAFLATSYGIASYSSRHEPYMLVSVLSPCAKVIAVFMALHATPMPQSHSIEAIDRRRGFMKLLMQVLQTVSFFSVCVDLVRVSAASERGVTLSAHGVIAMHAELALLYCYVGGGASARWVAKFLGVMLPYRILGLSGPLGISTVGAFAAMAGICFVCLD